MKKHAKTTERALAAIAAILAMTAAAVAETMQLAYKPSADGLGGTSAGVYRIPALAKSTNGVVVAAFDCRYRSESDFGCGGDSECIDTAGCVSFDNGATWSDPQIFIDVPNARNPNTGVDDYSVDKETSIGDPCVVYDPAGDKFWLMGITGGGLHTSHDSDGNCIADVVLYTRGTGEDDTWQEWTGGPEGNTRSVKQMILDSLAEVEGDVTLGDETKIRGILQGPGHGIVQRKTVYADDGETVLMPAGAIIFPMQYFPLTSNWANESRIFAVYSTDGGATWNATKLNADGTVAQENCIIELDDGSWLMTAKGYYRQIFRSTDFVNWVREDSLSPSQWVQGSCLRLGEATDGKSRYVACFSVSSGRSDITLRFARDTSLDEGSTKGVEWDCGSINIYPCMTGGMSYNSLVMLDDATLGVLFEAYGHIYLKKVDVSEILAGKTPSVTIEPEPPAPVASLVGDFGKASREANNLTDMQGRHAPDYSCVTIDQENQGLLFDAESAMDGLTVLVHYYGLEPDEARTNVLFASCVNSQHNYDRTGIALQPDGKLCGFCNNYTTQNADVAYTTTAASGSIPSSGVMAFTYSTSGTYLYYGNTVSEIGSSSAWGASGLKYSADKAIYGAAIGGMCRNASRTGVQAAKGMTIDAIAVFDKAMTPAGLCVYEWPDELPPAIDGVIYSNTDCGCGYGNSTVSGATLKIEAEEGDALDGKYISLYSLDFGYCGDHSNGSTHARRIAITVDGKTWTSANVVTNSTDKMTGTDGTSVNRLVYSFADESCFIPANTNCDISFLDADGKTMTTIRYECGRNASSIIDGVSFTASSGTYRPLLELKGLVVSKDDIPAETIFDWTPSESATPSGTWITSWNYDSTRNPVTLVGPDGSAQSINVTHTDDVPWIPCQSYAEVLDEYTLSVYGSADMVVASEEGNYAVLWCMGRKQNIKTSLVKDYAGNICLIQTSGVEGAEPLKKMVAGAVRGYHLFTVRFSTTNGASLQIDDGEVFSDSTFTTVSDETGFQVGSVRSGVLSPLEQGLDFAVLKMVAFGTDSIPAAQFDALCAAYPAAETFGTLAYNVSEGKLYLPSLTMDSGAFRIQSGTLEVPFGVTASLSALEFGDQSSNLDFGMNLAGRININTSSTGSGNSYSTAYNDCNNGRGVNFGEWTGNGTINVTGVFYAPNTIVELCHDAASSTLNVSNGIFIVKGVTSRYSGRASIVLSDAGTINYGEHPCCDATISKTYGLGLVSGTASWTDTDAITLNGAGDGTVFAPHGIDLVFSGTISGSGNASIDATNDGSVTFTDFRSTGDIKVRSGVLHLPLGTTLAGNVTVAAGAALDIVSVGGVVTGELFKAASIAIEDGGALTINGVDAAMCGASIKDGSVILEYDEAKLTHECVLRISEIMPKPTDDQSPGTREGMDVNGLESGWVEVENTSDMWADLADYRFIRTNRGKKTDFAEPGNLPPRLIAPHSRAVFYTSERYPNSDAPEESAFQDVVAKEDRVKPVCYTNLNNVIVYGKKVNPKKSPFVRLYYAPDGDEKTASIIDTVVIPSDLPEGWSIIVGETKEGEATARWMCPAPTRGTVNPDTGSLTRIGPNVGPLYELATQKKHDSANEFVLPVPPAVPGEDYEITFALNPVMSPTEAGAFRDEDEIASITLEYRTDLDDATLGSVPVDLSTEKSDSKDWGNQYTTAIPASAFPARGHLIQWRYRIADASGNEWVSPSFNNPDDGYEWYGTIVEPDHESQLSATLPTWHMFVDAESKAQMDIDASKQTLENNARVAIYDSSTSNYYDYVRIDLRGNSSVGFTKKSHGLRFAKAHPMTMVDSLTGDTVEEMRKTSLISEFADPSLMRQMIAFWLWRRMGNKVPYDFPVRCNLNGSFYQLAFNSERFTDELIEDVYKFDKYGYSYKNVGTFNRSTTAGSTEKKTPDDENESDLDVLHESIEDPLINLGANSSHDAENAEMTRFVVEKFDLPSWINYLASARITQETDDVWANVSAYYDNAEMKEGVRGTDTWMPLGYDFNLTFGQFYLQSGVSANGLIATNDLFKSHPLYGGWTIRCGNGNNGFEAVYQSLKFRRLYLRRLRTLMDQELKEPGTSEADTPFIAKMREMADLMRADAALDQTKWPNDSSDYNIDVWANTTRPADIDEGIDDIWENYVVPRREHLYVTHSVTNTVWEIGYGTAYNAGIPEAQSDISVLAPNITITNLTEADGLFHDEDIVVIHNGNDEAVDMSGWKLDLSVAYTFPAGTVCDANDDLYIVRDRRAYIAENDDTLTHEVIVGNATFNVTGAIALYDAEGTLVFVKAPETDEHKYLRLHSFCGNTAEGGGDEGEWFTLTNISDTVSLDLAGVAVCFLKQGDDETASHCHITLSSGSLSPLGSVRFVQTDWADNGWSKIQNNKQQITIWDKYNSVCQSLQVTQKTFPLAYGLGGWLVCDSQERVVADDTAWHQEYALANDGVAGASFSAESLEKASNIVAAASVTLTDDDIAAGLETKYLMVVPEIVDEEAKRYRAVVAVNPATVPVPVFADGTSAMKPLQIKSTEDNSNSKTVVSSISNAIVGLWYGFEVSDSLGDDISFEYDTDSFERATDATHTITASPRDSDSGFFRVKVLPANPDHP